MEWTHLATLEVDGRPSAMASSHVEAWTESVRAAVEEAGIEVVDGRFSVRLEFRLTPSSRVTDAEDLQHLVVPVLDGLDGVFGTLLWAGEERPQDDRVDHLEAWKRPVEDDEEPGVSIEVWTR